MNYYNEFDPFAAEWLKSLIKKGLIPDGKVDTQSIVDVEPDDLRQFTQCHFFAGIGGWSHALRIAGWPDDRPIWTGSCPCQPFSVAGKGKGKADERHLWPVFHQLIAQCRPPVVMGEQVAGKAGYDWFDGVAADLEGEGYASRAVDIPACAVNAPHIRQRLYWCAVEKPECEREGRRGVFRPGEGVGQIEIRPSNKFGGRSADNGDMADAKPHNSGCETKSTNNVTQEANRPANQHSGCGGSSSFWDDTEWLTGADGKTRRAKPGIRLLVDGVPNRVGRLRGYGNAIVPPLAAEIIKAFVETEV